MITNGLTMSAGAVEVHTTTNRGFTPEEVASRCVDRIISISDQLTLYCNNRLMLLKEI